MKSTKLLVNFSESAILTKVHCLNNGVIKTVRQNWIFTAKGFVVYKYGKSYKNYCTMFVTLIPVSSRHNSI